jgi:hypothetical protein
LTDPREGMKDLLYRRPLREYPFEEISSLDHPIDGEHKPSVLTRSESVG